MKVYVVTDENGSVVGSARAVERSEARDAPFGGRITPIGKQKIHEVEVPDSLRDLMKSPKEFHRELAKLI